MCSLNFMAKTKTVLINLRIAESVRDGFKIVADLRGATLSGLIHQFIVKSIREEKERDPRAFVKPAPDSKGNAELVGFPVYPELKEAKKKKAR